VINEFVDGGASLKEVTNHLRCGEVIVHRVIAFLTEGLHDTLRLGIALV
jgi:hypothetical protein